MQRILLTEDDADQRQLYREVLEEAGFEVVEAANGKQAVEVFERGNFDVVVLDIQMPGMDGIDTLGKLLSRDKRMPVVMHSAFPAYKANFLTWAADEFVIKTGNPAELVGAVRRVLEKCGVTVTTEPSPVINEWSHI